MPDEPCRKRGRHHLFRGAHHRCRGRHHSAESPRGRIERARWPVAEHCDSAADLRERLEGIDSAEAGELLVVTGPGWQRADALARIALLRGVPVTVWPQSSVGHTTTEAEHQTGERRLTEREREVLEWVAAGVSNKGIARRLGLSPNTVKFHIAALLAKLGAATRAEAVAAAARRGELSL